MAKQNQIDKWASSARNAEFGFIGAVVFGLDQFSKGNRLPLTKMIALANGKTWNGSRVCKGVKLTGFAGPLKRILDKALSDCDLTFKDGDAKWKVGAQGGVNSDVLMALNKIVGESYRSDKFKELFPVVKSQVTVTDEVRQKAADAARKRLEKQADELGMGFADLMALIAAPRGNVSAAA